MRAAWRKIDQVLFVSDRTWALNPCISSVSRTACGLAKPKTEFDEAVAQELLPNQVRMRGTRRSRRSSINLFTSLNYEQQRLIISLTSSTTLNLVPELYPPPDFIPRVLPKLMRNSPHLYSPHLGSFLSLHFDTWFIHIYKLCQIEVYSNIT